jgi:uncharacterized YccA/Bax inhibitor family protein
MRSSNPALSTEAFKGLGYVAPGNTMTIPGTINKTFKLLALVMLPALWIWKQFYGATPNPAGAQTWMWVGMITGFILSLVTIFKKEWAPISAPLYAVAQGLFLGGISGFFEQSYPGIVMQAVSLSIATLIAMLVVYRAGWIQATQGFKMGVIAATIGIAAVYFIAIILGFFGINVSFINGSSWFSILFSLFVVGIAALNFILDFDLIEQGSKSGAPKYMEWYGAFALMVTLVWLYIEMLRLLSKLNDRR